MTVLNKLASALGRKDEVPNQELAKSVEAGNDKTAVKELVENLDNRDKVIQQDCIKVLYEIGELNPNLIADYLSDFVDLLTSKNNRLQWGGMTALNCIVTVNPKGVYDNLSQIMESSDKGSVITKDHAVNILINLASVSEYATSTFSLLTEQLLKCPTTQFPMYAERALRIINEKNKVAFVKVLNSRIGEMEKESKIKRVDKIIKKVLSK